MTIDWNLQKEMILHDMEGARISPGILDNIFSRLQAALTYDDQDVEVDNSIEQDLHELTVALGSTRDQLGDMLDGGELSRKEFRLVELAYILVQGPYYASFRAAEEAAKKKKD